MKTKGWILVLISLTALSFFGWKIFGPEFPEGIPARVLAEYLLSVTVWGYGLYKGIRLLCQKRIPDYTGKLEKPDMHYSFSLNFWQFFYMYQLDWRHLSFTTVFVVYYCICLVLSEPSAIYGQAWLYVLGILTLYTGWFIARYKLSVQGENEIELSQEGIVIRREAQHATYSWNDINWVMFFRQYGIMHSNGSVKMLVITPKEARNTILYYLNHRNEIPVNNLKL